jgi:hypothetical protein
VRPPVTVARTVSRIGARGSWPHIASRHLAPRLRAYLKTPTPAWPEIVNAADWLRGELGVSKTLWGEACLSMGREKAAIAIAIVSAKPD